MTTINFNSKGRGVAEFDADAGIQDLVKFDNRHSGKKGDDRAVKVVKNFVLGEDVAEFRIDGNYFEGSEIADNPYNSNKARVSTAEDFLDLISTVLSDDGRENRVEIQGNDLFLRIDADDHKWRTDLKIQFVDVVDQIGTAFGLNTQEGFDDIIIGTRGDDFLHRGNGIGTSQEKGDDLLVGGGGADVFQFNSTGTSAYQNDGLAPTDHVADLDFSEGDILRFQDWGLDAFGEETGHRVDITTLSELEALGNLLNQGIGSAHTQDGNVYLEVAHTHFDRHQTVVLHGLGDQVSFQPLPLG